MASADGETAGTILHGLRRRKVVQWTLLYATGAWGLAQGLAHLVETYHWPEPVQQVGTLALILGLPVAVVVAWFHGERGDQRIGRTELAILSVLLASGGGALWWYGSRMEQASPADAAAQAPQRTPPRDAPSVAVLPFVNMSSDPEQEYFSDGLSEEILNALARTPGLYVPARSSSFRFKGQADDVAKLAAMLGVATVLEGSVRKADGRVRVTVHLINAADGYHLWSQTYDRELKGIFAIQSEIAAAITEELKLHLTAQQKLAAEVVPPTTNLAAYEAYLLGRHRLNLGQRESIAQAIEYLQQAASIDPDFAIAHAELAIAIVQESRFDAGSQLIHAVNRQQALDKAIASLDRALALAPDHADVLAAAGYVASARSTLARNELALRSFERSLAVNPSNGRVLTWRNEELWLRGRHDQLLAASEESLQRDPLSLHALDFRIDVLLALGRRHEVGPLVERVKSLDQARGLRWLAELADREGDRPAALRHCIAAAQAGDSQPRCGYSVFAALGLREEVLVRANPAAAHANLGDFREAVRLARAAYEADPAWWEWDLVWLCWYAGDFDCSWDFFRRARRSDEQGTGYTRWGSRPGPLIIAADSGRRLGHATEAQALHDRVADMLASVARAAAPHTPDNLYEQALLAAYEGRQDDAAALLIAGIATGPRWRAAMAAPLFAEIRGRSDFRAAMQEQEAIRERQRREVLDILCGTEPLPESLRPHPATCAGR